MSEETFSTDGPTCPHCARVYTPDEPHYFDERGYTQDECDECGKTFEVSVHHSVSWTCSAIETPIVDGEIGTGKES